MAQLAKSTGLRSKVNAIEDHLNHVHKYTSMKPGGGQWRHWGLGHSPESQEADLRWSDHFARVRSIRPREVVGKVRIEVLQAGGWPPGEGGDVGTLEDCYVVIACGGLVARTSTKENSAAPAWRKDEWRAFEINVDDASTVAYFAVVDEDEFMGVDDRPLGRCALPLRALQPGAIYDAWLPLRLQASRAESGSEKGESFLPRGYSPFLPRGSPSESVVDSEVSPQRCHSSRVGQSDHPSSRSLRPKSATRVSRRGRSVARRRRSGVEAELKQR